MDVKTQSDDIADPPTPQEPESGEPLTSEPEFREADAADAPAVEAEPASDTKTEEDKGESLLGFLWFLFKLLLIVLIIRSFVVSPFSIPSESMLPRLWNGDYLLAAKWPYGFSHNSLPFDAPVFEGRVLADTPERGDVVIFKHPIDHTDYIKRVIALPGDTIAMSNGRPILNGTPLPRESMRDFVIPLSTNTSCAWGGERVEAADGAITCRYTRFRETLPDGRQYEVLDFGPTPGDNFAPVTIPEGHMFVMGDNRDNSRDSRFEARPGDAVGIVPLENLVGRAGIIMWSTDGSGELLKPWTWVSATRFERIGAGL
ncbi:signal peptidase I [Erythrobacter sp.]|uniref:signal peptidase I n=1 Tax=Erythrobacter sp. TaxID=1042 RepID=UPI003C76C3C4